MMSDLDKLIAAVEGGAADDFGAVKPGWPIYRGYAESAYHGSLDAAKALHEALLPGWLVQELSQNSKSFGWNMLLVSEGGSYVSSHAVGHVGYIDNPARAWLIAILKAYRSTIGEKA